MIHLIPNFHYYPMFLMIPNFHLHLEPQLLLEPLELQLPLGLLERQLRLELRLLLMYHLIH